MNSSAPRAGDFVQFRSFPAVIQSADVRTLRAAAAKDAEAPELEDFCGGYLGYDDRARHALETSLKALGNAGGAFFSNGVFGSGKSHLLGLLALLADGTGWSYFLDAHPHLRPLQAMPPRLVVHFSLDDWSAAEHSLESICWREIGAEWQRRFNEPLPLDGASSTPGARSELFAAFNERCSAKGLDGCALFIDELSLFLGGREHHLLQQDAAWLQFLGQRARLNRGYFAVFAALQKTVEDIGDLDGYAISQIRDRFTTLPLSLAHLPSLIERRLVIRRDAAALQRFNHERYDAVARTFSRLDFGRDEWDRAFPFHPATVSLLEQIAPRYFSRTRSAALFCQRAADPETSAVERVLPPALFDDIVDELPLHPDLKPIHTAWLHWQTEERSAARDEAEAAHLRDCFKLLALWRIAGSAPTVAHIVNSLLLSTGLTGDAAYEYGRICLEKLRAHAPVVLERQSGEFQDRYALDFGTRVSDLARRFTGNALANLAPRDGRVARYVLSCSRDEALPLATLDATSPAPMWRNAPRRVDLFVTSEPPSPDILANRIAALASPGGADWLLFIAPPFSGPPDSASWREVVREGVSRAGIEARWRGAVAWWLPREASDDEWAQAREATAQHSLLHDPQLSDNRRGRAVLEFLKSGLVERESQLGRIAVRLLFEGTLVSSAGAVIDGGELAAGSGGWSAILEAVADWTLPTAFPRWCEVAPRARVLTDGNAQTLALEVLRRPVAAPYFAASHERLVRAIVEPLGIARAEAGRWKIAPPREELQAFFTSFIASATPATLAAIEAHAAKSEWGLPAELSRLCLCALLRSGEVVGMDSRGQAVTPEEIGLPLARSVRTFTPGVLLDINAWESVRSALAALAGTDAGARSHAAQQAARAALIEAREEWRATAELFSARLHQLKRALGGDWRECEMVLEAVTGVLHALDGDPLASVSRLDAAGLNATLTQFRSWSEALETRAATLVEAQLFLAHPQLVAPAELQPARIDLLHSLTAGESALRNETVLPNFDRWRQQYGEAYTAWHKEQNDPARLQPLHATSTGDALRALEAWDTLPTGAEKLAPTVRQTLREAVATLCPRAGTPSREPVCVSCRLRLGETVAVDTEPVTAALASARNAIRATLSEKRTTALQTTSARTVLQWQHADESLDTLLPLFNESTLRALAEAFTPKGAEAAAPDTDVPASSLTSAVPIRRSFSALKQAFVPCRTRAELETAFAHWLDGANPPASNDEVILSD